jgi:hypothetical protein
MLRRRGENRAGLTMKLFWQLLFFAFLIGAPLRICYDVAHPDLWSDWQHHPAWGVPLTLVVAFMVGLYVWAWREDRRRARMTHAERVEEDLRLLKKGR